MITINLGSFPEGTDIGKVLGDLLSPFTAHKDGHTHTYAIVLVDKDTGHGYELNQFEAPCAVTDDRANMATIIAALRDTADQLADAHADMLTPAPAQCEDVGPNGWVCQMSTSHDGPHSDGSTRWEHGTTEPATEPATGEPDPEAWREHTGCTTCATEEDHERARETD
jgi:hypothetical protein